MENLKHPQYIYQALNNKVIEISNKIESLHQTLEKEKKDSIKQILKKQQEQIGKSLKELEENSEWKHFTIAFFGETGAGKSTIIETLRILLKEESKVEQQRQFNEIQNKFNISEESFNKLTISLKLLEEKNLDLKQQWENKAHTFNEQVDLISSDDLENDTLYKDRIQRLVNEFDQIIIENDIEYKNLEELISFKKQNMSWWLKIIYIFKRLKEEKQMIPLKEKSMQVSMNKRQEVSALETEYKNQSALILERKNNLLVAKEKDEQKFLAEMKSLESKKLELSKLKYEFDEKLAQLEPFKDGAIIGDGRSDFTRDSVEFSFNLGSQLVKMIDVPGIEGDENKVIEQISNAVKRSHAVFYVTSKDAPPNGGTLDKIKQHLGDQTEVWSIFNKSVTNPRQLKGELIKNEDERNALDDLNKKMRSILGNAYRKDIVIAGLPAFYSVSTCLIPFSQSHENQRKFLEKVARRDDLRQFSRLHDFQDILEAQVIGDVEQKIQKSNFNKVNYILKSVVGELDKIKNDIYLLKTDVGKQVNNAKSNISASSLTLQQSLRNNIDKSIDEFKSKLRNTTYQKIDRDISNDIFKIFFADEIKHGLEKLQCDMKSSFEKDIKDFESDLKNHIHKLSDKLDSLLKDYQKDLLKQGGIAFNLNFNDMKSGVSGGGILGVTFGVAAAMWWNPAGWLAISAVVGGLVISFAKAVWGFFSSDFKMSEQKKNVDQNLSRICREISDEAIKNLNTAKQQVEKDVHQIKQNLDKPYQIVSELNEDLEQSIKEFKQLSEKIECQYGVA